MFTIYNFQFCNFFLRCLDNIREKNVSFICVYDMLNCFRNPINSVTITNTFDCQWCILMCKTLHYNIIMIYNQKDLNLLLIHLEYKKLKSPHLFKNSPRNTSYGYRRVHLIIKIFPWSLSLFFDTFGVIYISYLIKRTWEGFVLNDKSLIL